MNHVIEPTPEGAIGKEYLIEFNWDLNGAEQAGLGQVGPGQDGRGQDGQAGAAPAQAEQSLEGATGRVYLVWIEVGENGNPGVIQSGGRYDDVYVKTADGWRIKTRTFVPSRLGSRREWEHVAAQ